MEVSSCVVDDQPRGRPVQP
uniref:Uncharacterized protein n=1 Tax=Anguilla anguilla TaxID=7936 RepID=A0A0E9TDK8_ANGAN